MGAGCCGADDDAVAALRDRQRTVLWMVLEINAVLFVVELNPLDE